MSVVRNVPKLETDRRLKKVIFVVCCVVQETYWMLGVG